MTRAVVIGGGVAGIATAALLARGGLDVTLVERHATLGGRAATYDGHGFHVDTGPSWYVAPETIARYFSLLGRDIGQYLELVDLDPRFRAFFEGLAEAPADTLDLPPDPQAIWALFDSFSRGDGDATRDFVTQSARDYHTILERVLYSTYDDLAVTLRPANLAGLPRLAIGLFRSLDKRIARGVHHSRVRQLLGFPAIALAGSPGRLPASYGFLSHLFLSSAIQHPKGGFGAVIAALERIAREEGVDIRLSCDVARILVDPHTRTASGVVLHGGGVVSADVVVSCADLHHTETDLLADPFRSRPEPTWAKLRPAPSALVVVAGVKGSLPELAQHNVFFPKDWVPALAGLSLDEASQPPSPSFLYVSRPGATNSRSAPKGKEAIVLIVPLPADPLLGASESSRDGLSELTGQYLDQVGAWAHIPDLRSRSSILSMITPADLAERYSVWKGSAMGLEHTRRQTAIFRPKNASRRVGNLFYAGSSALPGVGVSCALVSAELVAKRLLGSHGTHALEVPAQPGFLRTSRVRGPLGTLLRGDVVSPSLAEDLPSKAPESLDDGGEDSNATTGLGLEPKPIPTVGITFTPKPTKD